MRALRLVRHQSTTMKRCTRANTIRNRGSSSHRERSAHAVAHRAHLALLVDGRLLVEPGNESFRVALGGVFVERAGQLHQSSASRRILEAGTLSCDRRLLRAIE